MDNTYSVPSQTDPLKRHNGLMPWYDGCTLHIYPGYTEFKPWEQNMNLLDKEFKGFSQAPADYTTLENPIDEPDGCELALRKAFQDPPRVLNSEGERHCYPNSMRLKNATESTRGLITCVSEKSARRLQKRLSGAGLDLWTDHTFSDDVFSDGKGGLVPFSQRIEKSRKCQEEYQRWVKSNGWEMAWKKEIVRRKSGKFKGSRIPHYHIAITGLSDKEKDNYESVACRMLIKWVSITGTENPNALVVALHRDKSGSPSSYRRIDNHQKATAYIGKYFGKTEPVDGYEPESIGRAWGCTEGFPNPDPWVVHLSKEEYVKITRFCIRGKRISKTPKGRIGLMERMKRGYAFFLYASEDFIFRWMNDNIPDIFKDPDPVPF